MNGLHIGLVGCGDWGRHILRDLLALGCHVTVVDRSERGCMNARKGGAHAHYAHIDQLPQVDGIVVATQTIHHATSITVLLEQEVPIFVEKPITHDVAAARYLVEQAGERIFVMDKWRYHPGVVELARLAQTGDLGTIQGLETNRLGWGHPHPDVDCIWILMPHECSIALEILGTVLPVQHVLGEWNHQGECMGVQAWFGDRVWHRSNISIRTPQRNRSIRLIGSEAVAYLSDPMDPAIHCYPNPPARAASVMPEPFTIPLPELMPLYAELRAFVEYLLGGPAPRSSAAEGLLVVERIQQLRDMLAHPETSVRRAA